MTFQSIPLCSLLFFRFSEDGTLYRCRVLRVEGSRCDVLYVDYGNREEKAVDELLVLPPAISQMPVRTHRCLVGSYPLTVLKRAPIPWISAALV